MGTICRIYCGVYSIFNVSIAYKKNSDKYTKGCYYYKKIKMISIGGALKVEINGSKKVLKLTNPIFITGVAGFIGSNLANDY